MKSSAFLFIMIVGALMILFGAPPIVAICTVASATLMILVLPKEK